MRAIAAAVASLAVVTLVAACSDLKSASPTSVDAERDAGTDETDDDDGRPPANDAGGDAATTSPKPSSDAGDAGTAAACGTCKSFEACDETNAGATCKPATIVWEVDGVVVTKLATYEAFYTASSSTYSLFFNHYGRNVQISFSGDAPSGTLTQCPGGGSASFGLITSDNSWSKLDALPARWKNLSFASCGAQSSGDTVTARDLTITSASPARVAGHYEIIVQGAGARAGSTLRVHGVFDVTPKPL